MDHGPRNQPSGDYASLATAAAGLACVATAFPVLASELTLQINTLLTSIDPFCKTSSPITITIYTRFKTSSTKTHELHCFSDFLHQNLTIPPNFFPRFTPLQMDPLGIERPQLSTTKTRFSLAFSPFPLQQHGACAVFHLLQNICRITLPQKRTGGNR